MRKIPVCVAFAVLVLCFNGCFINERGISNRFWAGCKGYYDGSGEYKEECTPNWVDLPLTPTGLLKVKPK